MKTNRLLLMIPAVIVLFLAVLAGSVGADPRAANDQIFVPFVSSGASSAIDCNLPEKNYGSLSVHGNPQPGDPETNANVKLGYRGWEPTMAELKLVNIDGSGADPKAPQFPGMFADKRTANMSSAYQRYRWDWDCDCPKDTYSPWDVTVLGLAVQPGETIHTPDSGYFIDEGRGYEYQVTYAGDSGITLYIGLDDDYKGYVVHIENVCVDPDLVELYRKLHDAGRKELPALRGHQAFGRALSGEIKVAVRDTGHFLDPRSRNDWWRGR